MVTHEHGEFAFAPPSAATGGKMILSEAEAHHLFRVRRVAAGAQVFVTDGAGSVYRCLAEADQSLKIEERLAGFGEPPRRIMLCAAVLKGDGNRDLVDQATQLGATDIILFHAQRSEGRLAPEKMEKLERVATTAIKQCGRACLPQIVITRNLTEALRQLPSESERFLAHLAEAGNHHEGRSAIGSTPLALVVGPEGGLTDEEIQEALEARCVPLQLARRRLRAETAICAGLSCLLSMAGEVTIS